MKLPYSKFGVPSFIPYSPAHYFHGLLAELGNGVLCTITNIPIIMRKNVGSELLNNLLTMRSKLFKNQEICVIMSSREFKNFSHIWSILNMTYYIRQEPLSVGYPFVFELSLKCTGELGWNGAAGGKAHQRQALQHAGKVYDANREDGEPGVGSSRLGEYGWIFRHRGLRQRVFYWVKSIAWPSGPRTMKPAR